MSSINLIKNKSTCYIIFVEEKEKISILVKLEYDEFRIERMKLYLCTVLL